MQSPREQTNVTAMPRHPTRATDSRALAKLREEWLDGAAETEQDEAHEATRDSAREETPGRWRAGTTAEASQEPLSWEPTPTLLQRALRGVSMPAAVGVTLFIAAIAITAVVMLRSLASGAEPALDAFEAAPGGAALAGEGAGTDAAGEAVAATEVIVHVIGEVRQPGVVELEAGSRVLDAIAAAGGATEQADLTVLNLALPLNDGEQIEVYDVEAAERIRESGERPSVGETGAGAAQGVNSSGTVNINTATADELTQLSGIGPALAQRIIDWRDSNGAFTSVEQLLEVSGIGAKTLDKFREHVGL